MLMPTLRTLNGLIFEAIKSSEDLPSTYHYLDSNGDKIAVCNDEDLLDAIGDAASTGQVSLKLVADARGSVRAETVISDPELTRRFRSIRNGSQLDLSVYKGSVVDAATKSVLCHLVDVSRTTSTPHTRRLSFFRRIPACLVLPRLLTLSVPIQSNTR